MAFTPAAGNAYPSTAPHSKERFCRTACCGKHRWLRANLVLSSVQEDPEMCAVISSTDGRWRAVACSADLPSACRDAQGGWLLKQGERGQCADGAVFDVPHHSKENVALQRLLQKSGASAAWLPLQGQQVKCNSDASFPECHCHLFTFLCWVCQEPVFLMQAQIGASLLRRAIHIPSHRAAAAFQHPAAWR